MGRDKAFVEVEGIAMARRVADALVGAGCSPVAAIGGDASALASVGLDVVVDRWPGEGPLGGILTALAWSGGPVLVLACDLPWVGAGVLRALVAAADTATDADVVTAVSDRVEPLCALWRPSSAEHLQQAFDGAERAVHRALRGLRVATCAVPAERLRNVNRPEDLVRGGPDGHRHGA